MTSTTQVPLASPDVLRLLRVSTGIAVKYPLEADRSRIELDLLPRIVPMPLASGESRAIVQPLLMHPADGRVLAIVDKPFPHALLDVMLLQASATPLFSVEDVSRAELVLVVDLIREFFRFAAGPEARRFDLSGSIPRISFNFDPWSLDRPGLQPLRRLHVHMYVIERNAIRDMHAASNSYLAVPAEEQRELIDPMSFLGGVLLRDLHAARFPSLVGAILDPSPASVSARGLPLGFNLQLAGAFDDAIAQDTFVNYLCDLHRAMSEAADEIALCMTGRGAVAPVGTRNSLLDVADVERRLANVAWLTTESRLGLSQLRTLLHSDESTLLRRPDRHPAWRRRHVPLNGLAYGMSIAPVSVIGDKPLTLRFNVQIRLFAEVGGGGLFGCDGVSAVLLRRGIGTLSRGEVRLRREFNAAFQDHVRTHLSRYVAA